MKTKTKKQNPIFRQGDVLIMRVDELPGGQWKDAARENGRIVLAHGEATGHAHAIAGRSAKLLRRPDSLGESFLDDAALIVSRAVALTHEEHAPINLPKGNYIVRRQREYSPEALRTVAD